MALLPANIKIIKILRLHMYFGENLKFTIFSINIEIIIEIITKFELDVCIEVKNIL